MKKEINNNLIQQPSFERELLRKIDQTTKPQIAHKAFNEFIVPHLKYIDAICEQATKLYRKHFDDEILKELNDLLLLALYQNPVRLLEAVKGLKNPEKFKEQLHLEIAKIGKEVLKQELLKDERAYKKMLVPLNDKLAYSLTFDEEDFQDDEFEATQESKEEESMDDINEHDIHIYKEPAYDPDEELVVSMDEMDFFRKVFLTMKERDQLILIEILPHLEKGRQLPNKVREKLMTDLKISNDNLSKLIDRVKGRFKKKAIVMKQQMNKVL